MHIACTKSGQKNSPHRKLTLLHTFSSHSMSSEWSSEIWLAEAVANSVHINSLVLVNGRQLSQMMVACLHGNIDYVEALLEVPGVKVDLQNDDGWHSLQFTCMYGHTAIAQLILNTCQCLDLVNLPNKMGMTCLIIACQNGYTETVLLLLQNGAHVNMQDNDGWPSLMFASQNGHTETVLLLLQNGAHVNMQDNDGWPSLIFASQNGHTKTVLLLLQNGAHVNMQNNKGSSSLMAASQNGYNETVLLLLQNGAHVSMQNNEESSSLMFASKNGHTETVLLLLQNGAHVNMQNNKGLSSLIIASQNGHTKTVLLLLQNGAHVNMQNNKGSSLMIASQNGHTETVLLLLQNSAHVIMQDKDGWPSSLHLPLQQQMQIPGMDDQLSTVRGSALDMAVIRGRVEVVSLLVQCGAKVYNIYYLLRSITLKQAQANAKSGNSDESHWEKYSIILQILFSHDSDLIGRVQCTNPSTLYMACAFGVVEMVSLLIEFGADVSDLYRTDASGFSYWCSFVTIISSGSFLSATAKTSKNQQ